MGFWLIVFNLLALVFQIADATELFQEQPSSSDAVALKAFKRNSVEFDPNGVLADWTDPTNHCSWHGVTCSPYGRVVAVDLSSGGLRGPLQLPDLLALSSLKHLNLHNNIFSTKNLSAPTCYLETIDLSFNSLHDPIPADSFFFSCHELSYANLSSNLIPGGSIHVGHSLLQLDLSGNLITEFEVLSNALSNCKNCLLLETLNLAHNKLQHHIPGSLLGILRGLKKLNLAGNFLNSEIPPELGWACRTLEDLDLSANSLTGKFPSTFLSCLSLRKLDLSDNQFTADILAIIVRLPSLRYLNLSFNKINGFLPVSLTNCTQLKILDLSANALTGYIPSDFCSFGKPSALEKLYLADNYLLGEVPRELGKCENLRLIDISFNNLNGSIPSEVWELPNLTDLVIWENNLSGVIPEGVCMKGGGKLETIILDNNFLTGSIPKSIGNCRNLKWLSLSDNRLTGEIPISMGNLLHLAILQMAGNSLSGGIPPQLGSCKNLVWLDLNSNNLNGSIPPELASQAGFIALQQFSGKQFAYLQQEGDEKGCRDIRLLEVRGIRTSRLSYHNYSQCWGHIYTDNTFYTFASYGSMIYLDLSHNSFTNDIPETLGSIDYLQFLNLENNRLTGNIPENLGRLVLIRELYLNDNNLQGILPTSLGGLSFLRDFDVSNNNLTGTIPQIYPLSTFSASSYENNFGLCEFPLPRCGTITTSPKISSSDQDDQSSSSDQDDESSDLFILVSFFPSFTLFFFLSFYYFLFFSYKPFQFLKALLRLCSMAMMLCTTQR